MSDLDFRKQLLLNEFKTLSKGKTTEEIIPLLLAVNDKAKKAGIYFSKDDCKIAISSLAPQMTEKELRLTSELFNLINSRES